MTTQSIETDPNCLVKIEKLVQSFVSGLPSSYGRDLEATAILFQKFYVRALEQLETFLPAEPTGEVLPDLGQQLMSYDEMAESKRLRDMRESKLRWCLETLERQSTEAIYEAMLNDLDMKNEELLGANMFKLKAAGTSLKQLGVLDIDENSIQVALDHVGTLLKSLEGSMCPKDKIDRIVVAHKVLVDGLTHQAAKLADQDSGADLILPCLIYTLIISQPTRLDFHLRFVEHFRNADALKGEASYCLVNMHAAVSFLKDIDSTQANGAYKLEDEKSFTLKPLTANEAAPISLPRRAASMFLNPGDIAATAVNTADMGIKSLGSTIENSYNYFFKRQDTRMGTMPPKTLRDVRNLVGSTTPQFDDHTNPTVCDKASSGVLSANIGRLPGMNMVRGISSSFAKPVKASSSTELSSQNTERQNFMDYISVEWLTIDAEDLTISQVRRLLQDYKQLATFVKPDIFISKGKRIP